MAIALRTLSTSYLLALIFLLAAALAISTVTDSPAAVTAELDTAVSPGKSDSIRIPSKMSLQQIDALLAEKESELMEI